MMTLTQGRDVVKTKPKPSNNKLNTIKLNLLSLQPASNCSFSPGKHRLTWLLIEGRPIVLVGALESLFDHEWEGTGGAKFPIKIMETVYYDNANMVVEFADILLVFLFFISWCRWYNPRVRFLLLWLVVELFGLICSAHTHYRILRNLIELGSPERMIT